MVVPLPEPEATLLTPPDRDEVAVIMRGTVTAVAPVEGLTATQRLLLAGTFRAMTGFSPDPDGAALGPEELAEALRPRNLEFRQRIVQIMLLHALVVRPLPTEVCERVAAAARALGVDDGLVDMARELAAGQLELAAVDFERNGYTASWHADQAATTLHVSRPLTEAWDTAHEDPELAARWRALEGLPEGSLGLAVSRFYRARGFEYPGEPGSVAPLLAQHDWVHVLADYGATVENELEVFALIARANDDPKGFSFLAMVVSLFETGYLSSAAGQFEASPGHLSHEGVAERVADAMRRGALTTGSNDFLAVDWFTLAAQPIEAVRAHFGLVAKGDAALAAGSVGPFEPGGMSSYQLRAGTAAAERRGVPYESWGASPA